MSVPNSQIATCVISHNAELFVRACAWVQGSSKEGSTRRCWLTLILVVCHPCSRRPESDTLLNTTSTFNYDRRNTSRRHSPSRTTPTEGVVEYSMAFEGEPVRVNVLSTSSSSAVAVAASLKIRKSVNILTTESGRYSRIRMLSIDSRWRSTKTMGRREEDEPARSSRVCY
ncbi:hypothetical protein D9613_012823 [Agrocybe pediades]|uniref:Uncharacterized protein n=1 Tax=Agrocybe pediades TaxID=84607 RepID=A0A8H4VTK5_9AGAR|nr:hypothetical protein D9613_012823 [Agrocybe pediades]